MKTKPFLIALTVTLTAICALAAPEKETKEKQPGQEPTQKKAPAAPEKETKEKRAGGGSDYPFWNSKKGGNTQQFVPGLNAALMLTAAQEEKLAAARNEAFNDPAVAAGRGLSKGDPSVTDEQRAKARAAMEAANAKLKERVATILTPAQNELIAKINKAYADTLEEIGTVYSEKFASTKGVEGARERVMQEKQQDTIDRFQSKLDAMLTPEQKSAMTRAAEEEQKRNAKAPEKKPAK